MQANLAVPKAHRRWAVACHLSGAMGLVMPWIGFAIGPFITWIALRNEHPSVEAHGRESLQFNLSMMLWMALGSGVAWLVGSVAWFLLPAILALWIVCIVMASMKAAHGEAYRYPVTLRFLD